MADRPQLSIVSYAKGTYIIIEGKQDQNRFFIIQRGNVQVFSSATAALRNDARLLSPGDFLGVLATMSGHSQIETAIAQTDVILVAVDKTQFEGLIQFNTPIAMKIIQQFSRRMRLLNNMFTELTVHGESNDEDNEMLFNNANHYQEKKTLHKAFYCYKRYVECYPRAQHAQKAIEEIKKLIRFNKPGWFSVSGNKFLRKYPKDSIICAEGEVGTEMYSIQSGRVNITKIVNNAEVVLAVLKSGDMFGEMALLESKPRSAGAVALEDCVVMIISKQNFASMANTSPQLISRLTHMLAERVWFSYKQLANASLQDPLARFFDLLCIQMEKESVRMAPFTAYVFNLSLEQLMKLANIKPEEKRYIMQVISTNKMFKVVMDKLVTSDAVEIVKLADMYKKQAGRRR